MKRSCCSVSEGEEAGTHQVVVRGVGVVFGKRFGHSQSHTVRKDGQQDEDIERSEDTTSENYTKNCSNIKHQHNHIISATFKVFCSEPLNGPTKHQETDLKTR